MTQTDDVVSMEARNVMRGYRLAGGFCDGWEVSEVRGIDNNEVKITADNPQSHHWVRFFLDPDQEVSIYRNMNSARADYELLKGQVRSVSTERVGSSTHAGPLVAAFQPLADLLLILCHDVEKLTKVVAINDTEVGRLSTLEYAESHARLIEDVEKLKASEIELSQHVHRTEASTVTTIPLLSKNRRQRLDQHGVEVRGPTT